MREPLPLDPPHSLLATYWHPSKLPVRPPPLPLNPDPSPLGNTHSYLLLFDLNPMAFCLITIRFAFLLGPSRCLPGSSVVSANETAYAIDL